ncbi:MAG TPA: class I SAM-dependent methyltransferase [Kiritimatiellia bacterium]|nr:class I SAM-dependent methyltransferase [Kiritimatiellia bacterium]
MNVAYDNEHHLRSRERGLRSAASITRLVYPLVQPHSVVDVGCGLGYWLKSFLDAGAEHVLGIDGDYIDRAQLAIPADCFRIMDLNRPTPVEEGFDLAISIEVAEHLRPDSGEAFVGFLCGLSQQVLFSAAIPGQPGHNHINPRWPGYWKSLFQRQGYVAYDFIRPRIWHEEDLMLCHRQNLLFFVHEERAESFDQRGIPRANCLTLVDEDVLSARDTLRATWSRLLGRLVGTRKGWS